MTDGSKSIHDDDGRAVVLAGRLVQKVPLLRRHGEVIATGALAAMLDHPPLRAAFEMLLELEPDAQARWLTEAPVADEDRWGRIDLVRKDAPGRLQVVVEAKLAHRMSAEQMELYASPPGVGLVVLLVPAHRRAAAHDVLVASRLPTGTRLDVKTWEEIIETFRNHAPSSELAADVDQFTSLVQALSKPIIEPFGEASPRELLSHRTADLELLVDYVTVALQQRYVPGKRLLTMLRDRDSTFLAHRHVEIVPGGTHLAVGIAAREPETAVLWVRYHSSTPGFADLNPEALTSIHPVRDWDRHLWIGLPVPSSPDLGEMVETLRVQVAEIHERLSGGTDGP